MATDKDFQSEQEQAIRKELEAVSNEQGKVDIEALRQRNTPLATVIDEFVMSKTARDVAEPIVFDVMTALDNRKNEKLNSALEDLEKNL